MSRIRCPRCNEYVTLNKQDLALNRRFILTCPCGKEFAVRMRPVKPSEPPVGFLKVLENEFCHKQILPLHPGNNTIGRMCKGTEIELPIDTGDMSLDRRHAVVQVRTEADGTHSFHLADNKSLTGTFFGHHLLNRSEQVRIEPGDCFTIGATTLFLEIE